MGELDALINLIRSDLLSNIPTRQREVIARMVERELLIGYFILKPRLVDSNGKERGASLAVLETHYWPSNPLRRVRGPDQLVPFLEELVVEDECNSSGNLFVTAIDAAEKASPRSSPRVRELARMFRETISGSTLDSTLDVKPCIVCRRMDHERHRQCDAVGIRVIQVGS